MKIHHLKPAPGAHKAKSRKGRGEAARKGKTAGRGTKGSGAHGTIPAGFEGGQMPLQRRLPKLPGFTSRNRVAYDTVNLGRIDDAFDEGAEVTPETLREKGLIRRGNAPVKILGDGALSKSLSVAAHAFTGSARTKVEAGGGTVRQIPRRPAPESRKP
ncbi:MAG: 50S ribosomal protein L15 [Nitriliruptorales bacterium]|nr:50S ribosomal protein L15 [Nitriliruptorales bacterium]